MHLQCGWQEELSEGRVLDEEFNKKPNGGVWVARNCNSMQCADRCKSPSTLDSVDKNKTEAARPRLSRPISHTRCVAEQE